MLHSGSKRKNIIKPYLKIGDSSRFFRLNHGVFKQGRLLNIILDGEILCYDLRNPGESILAIEHFTQQPPFISTKVQDLQDLGMDKAITKKTSLENFKNFFNSFVENPSLKLSASSSIETEADIFKTSHLLYSPCHNGEVLLLNNFQPLRKKSMWEILLIMKWLKRLITHFQGLVCSMDLLDFGDGLLNYIAQIMNLSRGE